MFSEIQYRTWWLHISLIIVIADMKIDYVIAN